MSTIPTSPDVVAELAQRVARLGDVEWVAGRLDDEALVVLVRRAGEPDVVEGVRVTTDGDDATALSLQNDALLEIIAPQGTPVRLAVPWADGLVPDPQHVRWQGSAIAQSAFFALGLVGTSAQGCDGLPL